jgi:hypothetical protein
VTEIWIAVIVCIVVILSGALPLLRDRYNQRPPLPPRKTAERQKEETLPDWRNGK